MNSQSDTLDDRLLGALLLSLLGGGLLVSVALSIVLAPFAPLFAVASGGGGSLSGGGGACDAGATRPSAVAIATTPAPPAHVAHSIRLSHVGFPARSPLAVSAFGSATSLSLHACAQRLAQSVQRLASDGQRAGGGTGGGSGPCAA